MQYGCPLDRILHKVVFAEPALGIVYLLKADILDGFYRIGLRLEDAPKLVLIFPSISDEVTMVDNPLTLPMGLTPPPPFILYGQRSGSGSC